MVRCEGGSQWCGGGGDATGSPIKIQTWTERRCWIWGGIQGIGLCGEGADTTSLVSAGTAARMIMPNTNAVCRTYGPIFQISSRVPASEARAVKNRILIVYYVLGRATSYVCVISINHI